MCAQYHPPRYVGEAGEEEEEDYFSDDEAEAAHRAAQDGFKDNDLGFASSMVSTGATKAGS